MALLSEVGVDFEELFQQLQSDVTNRNEAWKDLSVSGTGQTLLEYIAGIGTLIHFNTERGIQETFLDTALVPTSIRSAARMLGTNPRRVISARTTADIVLNETFSESSVTVPALSSFSINGQDFYNPSQLTFPAGINTLSEVELEQGLITTETFIGNGQNRQIFQLKTSNFQINENLMVVTVDGVPYTRERRSLFQYDPNDTVFLELTMPDGSVLIVFGDSEHGTPPANGSTILVTYAVSNGLLANNAKSGLPVALLARVPEPAPRNGYIGLDPAQAITLSGIVAGASAEPVESLRFTAPRLHAAVERAIIRQDYRATSIAFTFTDIADARVWGEREIYDERDEIPVSGEAIGLLDIGTLAYNELSPGCSLFDNVPIKPRTVTITLPVTPSLTITMTDDGFGGLIDENGNAVGTINYLFGTWTITLIPAPTVANPITASYYWIRAQETPNASNMNIVNIALLRRDDIPLEESVPSTGIATVSKTINQPPVQPGSVIVFDEDQTETFTDDGNGNMLSSKGTPQAPGGVNYVTGFIQVSFDPMAIPTAGKTIFFKYAIDRLTPEEKVKFLQYMEGFTPQDGFKHVTTQIRLLNVEAVTVEVAADLYLKDGAPFSAVRDACAAAYRNLFIRQPGIVGFSRPISDFYSVAQNVEVNRVKWVDYVNIQSITVSGVPIDLDVTKEIPINRNQYPIMRSTIINTFSTRRS